MRRRPRWPLALERSSCSVKAGCEQLSRYAQNRFTVRVGCYDAHSVVCREVGGTKPPTAWSEASVRPASVSLVRSRHGDGSTQLAPGSRVELSVARNQDRRWPRPSAFWDTRARNASADARAISLTLDQIFRAPSGVGNVAAGLQRLVTYFPPVPH
jgi:hypothetical protein